MQIIADRYVMLGTPLLGGMSQLGKALDTKNNGTPVAIKLYRSVNLPNDILNESFKRERMALRELKHRHIVSIIDEGFSDNGQTFFVVLEWLELNLAESLKSSGGLDWNSFYETIGKPILEGVAFAHSRSYVHRDIKTNNIMFGTDGGPKLIDFGTSKLRRYIQYGLTLREFSSQPFSPPEQDDGSNSYAGDTYAYCVTALDIMQGGGLRTREDVLRALTSVEVRDDVREVLGRALAENPDDRYASADALWADLEACSNSAFQTNKRRPDCYIQLTDRASETIKGHFDCSSREASEGFFLADINEVCGIRRYNSSTQLGEGSDQYHLFGAECSYHVKVDSVRRDRLVVLNVRVQSPTVLERSRKYSLPSPVMFRCGTPINRVQAEHVIDDIAVGVTEFSSKIESTNIPISAGRLFEVWRNMLEVKFEYELQQQDAIEYDRFDVDGRNVILRATTPPEPSLVGEQRVLRLLDRSILVGEITEVDLNVNEIVLTVSNALPDAMHIAREGQILADANSNKVSLERQRDALEAVRGGTRGTVRADLLELIIDPAKVRKPVPVVDLTSFQKDLDDDKIEAVKQALGADDFLLIEGPPGTGKTTVIAEIILQEIARNPVIKILLTSQTHIALDNAIERLEQIGRESGISVSITRLGRIGDDRVGAGVQKFLLPKRIEAWKETALQRSTSFLERWSASKNLEKSYLEIAILIEQLIRLKSELETVAIEEERLSEELALASNSIDEAASIADEVPLSIDIADRPTWAGKNLAGVKDRRISSQRQIDAIATELARFGQFEADFAIEDAESLRGLLALYSHSGEEANQFREMLKINAEWKLRFGVGSDFQSVLMASTNLVAGTCIGVVGFKGAHEIAYDLCILDEASKATASESLVPLARARRWILVGDLKQLPPFQDEALRTQSLLDRFDLDENDLKVTLFSHLLNSAVNGKIQLSTQRRMVREIGDLIRDCFYGRKIETKTKRRDLELIQHLGKAVVWKSTSRLVNRSEHPIRGSLLNTCEAEIILQELIKLNSFAQALQRNYSVCVLSPYSGQVVELRRRIGPHVVRWPSLVIEVRTVDSYQGKEADVSYVSLARSQSSRSLGFLKEPERLNVALSRGRYGLIIVGDRDYLANASDPNPFKGVIDYIQKHPNDCKLDEISL